MHIDELHEQTKNARVMPSVTFEQLADNIRASQRLESLPFCALDESGKLWIISGHHRVRAARAAGIKTLLVLVDVSGLSRSEVISKQLSHNAITGVDNLEILGEMFSEMDTLNDMLRSAVDPESLSMFQALEPIPVDTVRLIANQQTLVLQFYDHQTHDLDAFVEAIPIFADEVWLIPAALRQKYETAIKLVNEKLNIKSPSAAFARLVEIALDYLAVVESDQPAPGKPLAKPSTAPARSVVKGTPHYAALEALKKAKAAARST